MLMSFKNGRALVWAVGGALALLAGLLSLAGIPFVAGFWAKLWIFMAAYRAGHVELVLLGASEQHRRVDVPVARVADLGWYGLSALPTH